MLQKAEEMALGVRRGNSCEGVEREHRIGQFMELEIASVKKDTQRRG